MTARRSIKPQDDPMREVRPLIARYEDLFKPTCQAFGCTDDAEKDEVFCKRHRLIDAF
jgi:hypothetical protein